jgi:hypothetical protein
MLCLGISTANSGSAANSDSRSNSPGSTAVAQPVSPQVTTVNPNEITPLTLLLFVDIVERKSHH